MPPAACGLRPAVKVLPLLRHANPWCVLRPWDGPKATYPPGGSSRARPCSAAAPPPSRCSAPTALHNRCMGMRAIQGQRIQGALWCTLQKRAVHRRRHEAHCTRVWDALACRHPRFSPSRRTLYPWSLTGKRSMKRTALQPSNESSSTGPDSPQPGPEGTGAGAPASSCTPWYSGHATALSRGSPSHAYGLGGTGA